MSFEFGNLLWLLLPLAAFSGWMAAKLDERRRNTRNDLPSAYFKGLNYLLNEQPDKAIEVFIQVLEVNSETVETHLALGNLFRRRGEVERAIRIHQNLIARPTLDKNQRSHALLELGQDYLKAGLLDRAENLFLELAEVRPHSEQALRFLMSIYQQEKEWESAVSVCRRLSRISGKHYDDVIAQYYCEMAEDRLARGHVAQARELVRRALASDVNCVRASIILGSVEATEGRHKDAIRAWRRIEEQDPLFLGEVAANIGASFRALNDDAGMYEFFNTTLQRHGGVGLMLALADVVQKREGVERTEDFVVDWLRRQPSVHGLHKLIELNLIHADEPAKQDLVLLKGLMQKLAEQQRGYACRQCGFKGKSLHWQCPSCNRWNTIKPEVETVVE